MQNKSSTATKNEETMQNSSLDKIKERLRFIEETFDEGAPNAGFARQDLIAVHSALLVVSSALYNRLIKDDEDQQGLSLLLFLLTEKLWELQGYIQSDVQEIQKIVNHLELEKWISNPLND